jgi:hypothetical protein
MLVVHWSGHVAARGMGNIQRLVFRALNTGVERVPVNVERVRWNAIACDVESLR